MDPSASGERDVTLFHADHLQNNVKVLNYVRTFMALVGGCVAGILGLTGLRGVLCFVALHVAVSVGLLMKMQFNLERYTTKKPLAFALADVQKHMLSFVLSWTLLYALCYIY